ncbi:hypothetical protein Btru_009287 [Bulinus truncatus]|nr:hypothetical protein Btru_009287 [Bulinus truncatus]
MSPCRSKSHIGCNIKFKSGPSVITIGHTKEISIKCSIDVANITSITLSRKLNQEFEILAYITRTDGFISSVNEEDMIITGNLTSDIESLLNLRWTRPGLNDVGTYQCLVTGTDRNGFSWNLTEMLNVSYEVSEDVCRPSKANRNLYNQVFFPQEINNGKTYYLSRQKVSQSSEAIKICSDHDSYLIEVDDLVELQVALELAKKYGRDNVLIAGTDEKEEGRWIFPRTGRIVTFFNWQDRQPDDYKTGEDCRHFYIEVRADKLNDIPCDSPINFICESN